MINLPAFQTTPVSFKESEEVSTDHEGNTATDVLSANNDVAETAVDRLVSQHELIGGYRTASRPEKTVELLEDVVARKLQDLAEDHPSLLSSQHKLAAAYRASGQLDKAVQLFEYVVATRRRVLEEDHPGRLASQHELAGAYRASGDVARAAQLLEEVVAIKLKILPDGHQSRLASMHELSGAYRDIGQPEKAVELLEHVVATKEKVLVESNPSRLASQHELAGAYHACGQADKAVPLFEHVIGIKRQGLAEDHPSLLASQHELARAYNSNGQIFEAIQLLESVVSIKQRMLDEASPSLVASKKELAGAYRSVGLQDKAAQLLEDATSLEIQPSLKDHADWCSTKQETVSVLSPLAETATIMEAESSERLREATSSVSPSILSDGSSFCAELFIEERKSRIINNVVMYATEKLRLWFSLRQHTAQNTNSDTSDTQGSSRSLATGSSGSLPRAKKRKIGDNGNNIGDDDFSDAEQDDTSSGKGKEIEQLKLACPYFKYNPAKYKTWGHCPGPGWSDIHRVKEHLYRRHRQPRHRCGRCWQPFEDEQACLDHQRASNPCPLREIEPIEGFDASQERQLKSRKRTQPDSSEAQKWRAIFSILFPHVLENEIPSPYYEYEHLHNLETGSLGSLALCEQYIIREVPSRLRQELRPALDRNLNIMEESLRQMATDRIRDILRDVFREFRDIHQPNSPSTQRPSAITPRDAAAQTPVDFSLLPSDQQTGMGDVPGVEELPLFEFNDADFSLIFDGFPYDANSLLGSVTATDTASESKVQSDSGYDSNNPLSARSALSEL
ncbi:TPR-like protein [Thozetella sp. PMI_491]|nr:TPR-like protein [Thozetella sp. PMI_491]